MDEIRKCALCFSSFTPKTKSGNQRFCEFEHREKARVIHLDKQEKWKDKGRPRCARCGYYFWRLEHHYWGSLWSLPKFCSRCYKLFCTEIGPIMFAFKLCGKCVGRIVANFCGLTDQYIPCIANIIRDCHRDFALSDLVLRINSKLTYYRSLPLDCFTVKPTVHSYLQRMIACIAETYGYSVGIESPVLGSKRVDLILTKDNHELACEVSIKNNVDYEVSNVRKCISAGYGRVLFVSTTRQKLDRVEESLRHSLSESDLGKVTLIQIGQLNAFLDNSLNLDGE